SPADGLCDKGAAELLVVSSSSSRDCWCLPLATHLLLDLIPWATCLSALRPPDGRLVSPLGFLPSKPLTGLFP
ncbi:unnamed protein product, partial [Heterosigma akashiwo]